MEESPQLGVSHQYSSSLPTVIADVEWIAGWGYGSSGSCLHASPAFSSCRSGAPLPLPMVWPQQFSRGDCFQEDVCLPPEESLRSVFVSRQARFSVVSTFTFLIHINLLAPSSLQTLGGLRKASRARGKHRSP